MSTFSEQAAEYHRQAEAQFHKSDLQMNRGNHAAGLRAIHEGRRLQALADRYQALAAEAMS